MIVTPAEHVGKRMLILCTGAPMLPLWTCALLHGFNHIYLGYFGTKSLSSALALPDFCSSRNIRTSVLIAGMSLLFSNMSICVATATTAGMLEYIC
jgi:hypothetical protein